MGVNSANDLLGRRAGRRAELELWGIQGSELRVVVIFTKAMHGKTAERGNITPQLASRGPLGDIWKIASRSVSRFRVVKKLFHSNFAGDCACLRL